MTEQERLAKLETQFEQFMRESRDARQEMRHELNQQREDMRRELKQQHEDIQNELNQQREDMRRLHDRQDALQAKTEEKIDGVIKHIQNLTLAAIVGFGAIVAATGGLIVATLMK